MECSQGSPSYYSVLGIRADSSNEEIRRAYRKLAMVRFSLEFGVLVSFDSVWFSGKGFVNIYVVFVSRFVFPKN